MAARTPLLVVVEDAHWIDPSTTTSNGVGRAEEIDLLLKRWEQAKDGEGQAVLLSGEAGVGKSRIASAFRSRLDGEGPHAIQYFCSQYHQNSALHPVIEQLERELKFEKSDSVEQKLAKLEGALAALDLPTNELAPRLAALLSVPSDGRYPVIVASP